MPEKWDPEERDADERDVPDGEDGPPTGQEGGVPGEDPSGGTSAGGDPSDDAGPTEEPPSAPDPWDPEPVEEPDDIVEAARRLDPGADALPAGADPLASADAATASSGSLTAGIHRPPSAGDERPDDPPSGAGSTGTMPRRDAHGQFQSDPAPRGEEGESGPERDAPAGRHDQDVLRPGGGPPVRRPGRVIAMANQKGGVGKTTSVINLGAALAELGNRVLLVDMDPQGSLGVGIGAEPHTLGRSVYNLLMNDGTSSDEVILQTRFENLHVLPSNIDLAAAEIMLVQEVAREQSLRRVLDRLRYRYDFILVDCPPSLGLLTINGLTAADGVIVPLECEYFALRGMTLLMNTIRKVQERLNPELEIKGILATMVDTRTIHAREVLERVHEAFGSVVFKSTINKTIRFAEAPVAGEPILTYAAENRGADAYRELAREVLSRESTS